MSERYEEERQKYEEVKRQRSLEQKEQASQRRLAPPTRIDPKVYNSKEAVSAREKEFQERRQQTKQNRAMDDLFYMGERYPSMRDRVAAAAADGSAAAVHEAVTAIVTEIRSSPILREEARQLSIKDGAEHKKKMQEAQRKQLAAEEAAREEALQERKRKAQEQRAEGVAMQQQRRRQRYADQNRKIQQDLVAAATEQAMAGTKTAAAQSMRQEAISDIFEAGLAEDKTIDSMDERQLLAAILKELNLTRRDMWVISGKQPGVTMNKLTLGRASHQPGAFTGGKRRKTKRRGRKSRRNKKSRRR